MTRRNLFCAAVLLAAFPLALHAQFVPGELFRGTDSGIFRVPEGGGTATTPFAAAHTSAKYGQIVWRPDLSVAYFSEYGTGSVKALYPDGSTAVHASGLSGPTGLVITDDGRLLVAAFDEGAIRDITVAGEPATVFAYGLSSPRSMLKTQDGRILVTEQNVGEITDITAGGDFGGAPFFAKVPIYSNSITQDSQGRVWVGVYGSMQAGIYDITSGGERVGADAQTTGIGIIAVAADAQGRLVASAHDSANGVVEARDVTNQALWSNSPVYATFPSMSSGDTAMAFVPGEISRFTLTTDVIRAKGDLVPGTPGNGVSEGAVFRAVGIPDLNRFGLYAYAGQWASPTGRRQGIFVGDSLDSEFSGSVVAVSGTPAPSVVGATFSSFRDPLLADNGGVVFLATLSGVEKPLQQTLYTDLSVTSEEPGLLSGGLTLVAQSGVPLSQISGATIKRILNVAVAPTPFEGATAVYFTASLTLGSGEPAVTKANDLSLWRWINGELQLIAREGGTLGGEGEGLDVLKTFSVLTARRNSGVSTSGQGNGAGEFEGSEYLWGTVRLTDGTRAIGMITEEGVDLLYRSGDTAPDSGSAVFKSFGLPTQDAMTAGGFLAQLRGTGVTPLNNSAIFVEDEDFDLFRLVGTGDDVPELEGFTFTKLRDPVMAVGRAAFGARIGGPGTTKVNDDGLWFADFCGCLSLVAREGAQPVGVPAGAQFTAFPDLALPEGPFGPIFVGRLLVPKPTEPNPANVSRQNDYGFWVTDPDGRVHLALREGDTLDVRGVPKTIKTLRPLPIVLGSAAQTRSHNESPFLVYQVVFTDLSTAIVRTSLGGFLPQL